MPVGVGPNGVEVKLLCRGGKRFLYGGAPAGAIKGGIRPDAPQARLHASPSG